MSVYSSKVIGEGGEEIDIFLFFSIDHSTHTRDCAGALINFTGSSFYKGDTEDVKSPSRAF